MFNTDKKIKIIATDFDGVLTDGGVYLSSDSDIELKKVSYKDLMGLSLAVKSGFKVAIISGEKSQIIDRIAQRFGLEDIHQGIKDKLSVLKRIAEKYSVPLSEVCYIGDDINDIFALEQSGVAVTVPGANYKVRRIPNVYVTTSWAGDGAFREVVDSLLEVTEITVH